MMARRGVSCRMDALRIPCLLVLLMALLTEGGQHGEKQPKSGISVCCNENSMRIHVTNKLAKLVVKGKEENNQCKGFSSPIGAVLVLDLNNADGCGTQDKWNTLVIEIEGQSRTEMRVDCTNQCKRKRDLPPSFVEPDFIEITSEVTGTAPIPILSVGVRQNGQLVNGQINVRPGTPLTMEVFLDDTSADIYGILMNYMEVTDMANKRETIIFNGCSVDPILFDNFLTPNGNYLSAKFRAFKFPETSYVMFRGTVDVCLDKCQGIACSNGQLGYGRRRRGIDDNGPDPNMIFQVTMTTILKVTENLTDTKAGEKRLAEEVENQVAEDVKAVEQVIEEVAEERVREAAAAERALQGKTDVGNPWGRPAVVSVVEERTSSKRAEPDYIYYNSAVTLSQSVAAMGVTCAALLALLL